MRKLRCKLKAFSPFHLIKFIKRNVNGENGSSDWENGHFYMPRFQEKCKIFDAMSVQATWVLKIKIE